MKRVTLFALAALISLGLRAQAVVDDVAVVGNLTVPACSLTLDKDAKQVQEAMNQYMKESKLRTQKVEGYVAAINAQLEQLGPTSVNLYTKVEEQGKKKNRTTVVTACVISTDLTVDPSALRNNCKVWLGNFVEFLSRYEAQQQMAVEQDNLKKAVKDQKAAVAASNAIDKSINSDQQKIVDKRKEIARLQEKIKELEKDIANLEKNIEKSGKKKEDAERKVEEANQGVNNAQGEVDKYRQMAQ